MMRKSMLEVIQNATKKQALKKITTGFQVFKHSDSIEYVVFSAQPRNRKPEANQKQHQTDTSTQKDKLNEFFDPFAKDELEKDLLVSNIHHTHHLVLNKFNVVDEHVSTVL
jgi:ATP adenylyltransferase/5',5'''-P-1,P-4-tetraphosphate phosphorylase II